MKRRLFIFATFLLLGAIINVAVAWGAQIVFESNIHDPVKLQQYRGWEILMTESFGASHISSLPTVSADETASLPEADVPKWSRLHHLENYVRTDPYIGYGDNAFGWPRLALSYSVDWTCPWGTPAVNSRVHEFDCIPWIKLALRPLWSGFAVNTFFYAAIVWFLFTAPFALRRRRRFRRGLCPACAYPVGVSDVCTECGKPVTPRSPPVRAS